MLIDAREIESGQVLRADVCVIGAGAAGVSLARELAGGSLGVLVLESGGFERDAATTMLNEGRVIGESIGSTLERTRLRMFGGTANHYAGWSRPLEALAFERRSWIPNSGWPLERDDLLPFYRRASAAMALGPLEYDWRWWHRQRRLGTAVLEGSDFDTGIIQITTAHPGTVHREALVAAPNVRVCLWANAVGLVLDGDGKRLTAVDVATLTGRRFRAEARVYVLAAGGIETPRLLLASSHAVRSGGVGNEHDLVGRYFMEHMNLNFGGAAFARDWESFALYRTQATAAADPSASEIQVLGYLAPTPELQARAGLPSMEITLSAVPLAVLARLRQAVPSAGPSAGLDVDDVAALVSLPHGPAVASAVRVVAEQAPNPRSRVTLLRERDALGLPRVAVDWRPQASDRERLIRGLLAFGRTLGRAGFGRLQLVTGEGLGTKWLPGPSFVVTDPLATDLPGLDFTVGTGFHHMGTTRMHPDPHRGVVDEQCRVHSVANLYVAGSAVFPTGGSAGPTFTLVALALRLADHLRHEVLR